MRKKNISMTIVLVFVLGVFLTLAITGFLKPKNLTIVPINSICYNSSCETVSPYTCPLTATQCLVKGQIDCTNGGSLPKVIFRTNGQWIAYDIDGSGLRCYQSGGTANPSCNTPYSNHITIASDKPVFSGKTFYASPTYSFETDKIPTSSGTGNYCSQNVFSSTSASVCDLTATATYNPGYTEVYLGSSYTYSCNGLFEIYNNNNQLTSSESLNYQDNVPGTKSSNQITIYPNWRAVLTGGNTNHLYYGTYQERANCGTNNKNVCNSDFTGFYNCTSEDGNNYFLDTSYVTYCDLDNGFVCDNGLGGCTFPFTTKEIKLVDSNNIQKTGFTPTDSIKVSTKLISNKISSGDVRIKVWRTGDSQPKSNYLLQNYNFQSGQTIYLNIDNPTENGLYYVTVDVIYNGKTITFGSDQSYTFRIAPSISCSVNIRSPDRSSLYINSPIYIEVNTYDSVGPAEVDNINLDAKFKGNSLNINPNSYVHPPIASGSSLTYRYINSFTEIGQLDVTAQVTKNGIVSSTCSMTNKQVQSISVITTLTNMDRFDCIPKSTQTLTFETKNSLGEYIDTNNTLKVTEPDTTIPTDISNLIVRDSKGKYHFDFNFEKESSGGNGYLFSITSFSSEYNIGSQPLTGVIEVRSSCNIKECAKNSDCTSKGVDYICNNGKCEQKSSPNWMLYLIILISAIGIISILIIVIKIAKRPRQTVYTGLGGL